MEKTFDRILNTLKGADFWIALFFLAAGYVSWHWIGTTGTQHEAVFHRQIGVAVVLTLLAVALYW
jgi:hypothetical protein